MPQALACKGNKRDRAHDAEQRDEQVHRLLQLREGEGLILRLRKGCVVEHDAADHEAHGRGDVQDIRQLSAGKDLLPARLAAQRADQNGQRGQQAQGEQQAEAPLLLISLLSCTQRRIAASTAAPPVMPSSAAARVDPSLFMVMASHSNISH